MNTVLAVINGHLFWSSALRSTANLSAMVRHWCARPAHSYVVTVTSHRVCRVALTRWVSFLQGVCGIK